MGRRSTTGGVAPAGSRIQIYFRFQLQKCRPTLELKPTPSNLEYAKRLVRDIEDRIRHGRFTHEDLAREFPTYKGLARFAPSEAPPAGKKASTFREYGELWLGTKGQLSPSTLRGYAGVLKAHWYPWFGDRHVASILPSEVKTKLGSLPVDRKTHNNILDPGRQVFELARGDRVIARTRVLASTSSNLPDSEPDPFTLAEVDLILPKIRERWGDEVHDYYEAAFFSGMRPSEQIESRWDLDIDMRARETRVQRARVEGKVKDTKTYDNRTIEHHSRYHAALERQFARTGLAGGYVWLSPFSGNGRKRGEPWLDEHRQGEMFRTAVKLLRMRPRPAKNTRHTYATVLLMSDAKVAWCASQMGHSKAMFEKRYAKWIPREDAGAELAKVEAFTGQSAGQKTVKRRFKAV
jgi:integrase